MKICPKCGLKMEIKTDRDVRYNCVACGYYDIVTPGTIGGSETWDKEVKNERQNN